MVADSLAVAGLGLLATGLALVSVPLALVVVGSLLLTGGLWSHFRRPLGEVTLEPLREEEKPE